MSTAKPDIPITLIEDFCRKWSVKEFSLFGSVLREDYSEDSDIDILVSFEEGAPIGLYELVDMKDELEEMFGRRVDLVQKEGLRNPYRRKEILNTRKIVYAA